MARTARAVAVDTPHHVTQRGNGRQDVFFSDRDYEVYVDAFFDYAARYRVSVWGYCLMSNHVHFVAAPEDATGLARVFGRTHADYARYANLLRRSCGHFWQARFYSCALDGTHAWKALAYVERNPVRAGLVESAEQYRCSSAAAHCLDQDDSGRLDVWEWRRYYTGERWREALQSGVEEEAQNERIREATRRGAPLGSDAFVEQIGRKLGRRIPRQTGPEHPQANSEPSGIRHHY